VEAGLVTGTFGNVSGIDRAAGLFLIKPSGVPYANLTPADMVPVSLETGKVLEGDLRPSSDTPTHLEIYRAFNCGGIAHSHSPYATAFAQAGTPLVCMGTTHADYFRGDIPVTRALTALEVRDYETNTGRVVAETFRMQRLSPEEIPAVLVVSHGPFTWGADPMAAVEHSRVLEYLALVQSAAQGINPAAPRPPQFLIDKHFWRKHGKDRYYGQPEGS
jgi:L-ribulose-5-phosphate 4-epimerase